MKKKIGIIIISCLILLGIIAGLIFCERRNNEKLLDTSIKDSLGSSKIIGAVITNDDNDVDDTNNNSYTFKAIVLENNLESILVKPNEDENEYKSSDQISVSYPKEVDNLNIDTGDEVIITYNGSIMETYPAQISAYKIKKVKSE